MNIDQLTQLATSSEKVLYVSHVLQSFHIYINGFKVPIT